MHALWSSTAPIQACSRRVRCSGQQGEGFHGGCLRSSDGYLFAVSICPIIVHYGPKQRQGPFAPALVAVFR